MYYTCTLYVSALCHSPTDADRRLSPARRGPKVVVDATDDIDPPLGGDMNPIVTLPVAGSSSGPLPRVADTGHVPGLKTKVVWCIVNGSFEVRRIQQSHLACT